MPILLLPAALLAAPPAPTPAEVLVEALEGVSECVVEGRSRRLEARIRYAREAWSARRDTLAKRIPPAALSRLETCFLHMDAGGRAAAWAALDAQAGLADLLPQGPSRHRRSADLVCLRAWLEADAGRWRDLPDLEAACAPLLGPGQPDPDAAHMRQALDQAQAARTAANAPRFKGALRVLHGLLGEPLA